MNNFFVILAAGNGSRFKKKLKKQYAIYKNLRLFEHSLFKEIKSIFKKIILVVDEPKKLKNFIQKIYLL